MILTTEQLKLLPPEYDLRIQEHKANRKANTAARGEFISPKTEDEV
jgi:hypothetical protein